MNTAALRLLCITLLLDAASPSMTKCHGLNHMCLCGITEVGQSLWVDVLMCWCGPSWKSAVLISLAAVETCAYLETTCWRHLKHVRLLDIWREQLTQQHGQAPVCTSSALRASWARASASWASSSSRGLSSSRSLSSSAYIGGWDPQMGPSFFQCPKNPIKDQIGQPEISQNRP